MLEDMTQIMSENRVVQFTYRLNTSDEESVTYDISKTHLTAEDVGEYVGRLRKKGLEEEIEKMHSGGNSNFTEKRPVLHFLLRDRSILDQVEEYTKRCRGIDHKSISMEGSIHARDAQLQTAGKPASSASKWPPADSDPLKLQKEEIFSELIKMQNFCEEFNLSTGITGECFENIVSIGIGGSDLGPRMITDTLQAYSNGRRVFYISNVDGVEALRVLSKVNVARTLFIVVSKTFTTAETIENFKLVKTLALEHLKSQAATNPPRPLEEELLEEKYVQKHFIAVSSNIEEVEKLGIHRIFRMWDYVGGRYSLWSAVGISIPLYIGFENYLKLLRGASAADEDFFHRKIDSVSSLLAITELFYSDNGFNNKCIVAYSSYMGLLHKYLQQAEMESNGKRGSGQMIIWGGVGTDVQHSFFQLLHQGEQNILTEFILPVAETYPDTGSLGLYDGGRQALHSHHRKLVANCLAQSRSLMVGAPSDDVHRDIRGNKPSVTVLLSKLAPESLGAILAVCEHKIFVQGIYFGINSFDQFGVALGKKIALDILAEMDDPKDHLDPSTRFLLAEIFKKK